MYQSSCNYIIFSESPNFFGRVRQLTPTNSVKKCRVYPNPANNYATLAYLLNNDAPAVMEIFNQIGQKLSKYNLNVNETMFNFSTLELTPGVYYLKVQQNEKVIENLKLVILR